MIDYTTLTPQEKLDLWIKKNNVSEESFSNIEDKLAAKQLVEKTNNEMSETKKQKPVFSNNKITKEIDSLQATPEEKDFLKKLAKYESGYNPSAVNRLGYSGLYQFGKQALDTVGLTRDQYMSNSMIQHKAALDLANKNTHGLEKYYGKKINGITLNKYNLAAAMHLGGRSNVLDVLSGNKNDFKDANGTSIFKYLKNF